MPELFLKIDELVRSGEIEKARKVQYAVNKVIYKLCSAHGNMYAVIKEILRIYEDLDIGGVRKPLASLVLADMPIVKEAAEMIREAKSSLLD